MELQTMPDWTTRQDARTFNAEFELEMQGPGLYITGADVLLVTAMPAVSKDPTKSPWAADWPSDTLWRVHVFNQPVEKTILHYLTGVPTRYDSRTVHRNITPRVSPNYKRKTSG